MKYLLIALTLMMGSCVLYEDVECNFDSDCYLEEVCYRNQCIWVGAPTGTLVSGCTCDRVSYSPGSIFANDYCESGLEIIRACSWNCCDQYSCYPSWKAVCL